jgi:hypothetical protein
MTELQTKDLRFSQDEAAAFLRQALGGATSARVTFRMLRIMPIA